MASCSRCGKQVSMPFRCKFCEERFCSTHRLPENHDCQGLETYKQQSREEHKITYDVLRSEKEQPPAQPAVRDTVDRYLPTDATTALLAVIGVVFVMNLLFGEWFTSLFALNVHTVFQQPWTIVTAIFLHAGPVHLLFNGIVLFSFGRVVEQIVGTRNFLTVLFAAAIASTVGFTVFSILFQPVVQSAVGISGGLYGIVALLAVLRPNVQVLAFFIIPVRIRQAVALFAALDMVNLVAHALGAAFLPFASSGHLSGLIVGLYFGYRFKEQYRGHNRNLLDVMYR